VSVLLKAYITSTSAFVPLTAKPRCLKLPKCDCHIPEESSNITREVVITDIKRHPARKKLLFQSQCLVCQETPEQGVGIWTTICFNKNMAIKHQKRLPLHGFLFPYLQRLEHDANIRRCAVLSCRHKFTNTVTSNYQPLGAVLSDTRHSIKK
jgi:hypothetical protein